MKRIILFSILTMVVITACGNGEFWVLDNSQIREIREV